MFAYVDQETNIDGTFWAGGIVLPGVDDSAELLVNDGHFGFFGDENMSYWVFGSPRVALSNQEE